MEKKQKTNIYLNVSLHKVLKAFCKKKGVSMTDFIESLVSKAFNKN